MGSANLGTKVRELRQKQGWSQTELAKSAQCEQTLISRIESREGYEPGVFTLYKVATALGTTIDGLLKGVITFTPAPVSKNGAPPELVARMGEEIAVLHKSQAAIVDTLAQVSKTMNEVRADVADLKRGHKKSLARR